MEADALYRAVRRSSASLDQATERVGAATPVAEQVLAAVNTGRFDGTYTVEMFMAELSAALTAADDVDLILPQAEACLHLLELLAVIGGSDKAPAALALVYGEEKTCAEQGLDWTRAEQAYGDVAETTATTMGTITVPSAIIPATARTRPIRVPSAYGRRTLPTLRAAVAPDLAAKPRTRVPKYPLRGLSCRTRFALAFPTISDTTAALADIIGPVSL